MLLCLCCFQMALHLEVWQWVQLQWAQAFGLTLLLGRWRLGRWLQIQHSPESSIATAHYCSTYENPPYMKSSGATLQVKEPERTTSIEDVI